MGLVILNGSGVKGQLHFKGCIIGRAICGSQGTASWAGFLGSSPRNGHYSRIKEKAPGQKNKPSHGHTKQTLGYGSVQRTQQ